MDITIIAVTSVLYPSTHHMHANSQAQDHINLSSCHITLLAIGYDIMQYVLLLLQTILAIMQLEGMHEGAFLLFMHGLDL